MELVAASKMRKAANLTLASRDYSHSATVIAQHIGERIDPRSHQLLAARVDSKSVMVIVASSDRGLCGGFNAQALKKALEFIKSRTEPEIKIVAVGGRAAAVLKKSGYQISAVFESISGAPSFERARPVAQLAYQEFISGRVDRVFIIFTDYRSAISQIPIAAQLLPTIPEKNMASFSNFEAAADNSALIFEPSPQEVLDRLLPKVVETRLYQALLESSASEHSSRMLAMKNATSSATDMIDDLTFTFNQARQSGITREISEISAGKTAIE